MSDSPTATVETLTATVREVVVDGRRVTMSAYNQLDEVTPDEVIPMGRVRPKNRHEYAFVYVIGKHRDTGDLVRSYVPRDPSKLNSHGWLDLDPYDGFAVYTLWRGDDGERSWLHGFTEQWQALPLIVLAGLR